MRKKKKVPPSMMDYRDPKEAKRYQRKLRDAVQRLRKEGYEPKPVFRKIDPVPLRRVS